MRCDVLVIGGGSAGIAAAVSAARRGSRVLLVERSGTLGGMATASLVHSICGLYLLGKSSPVFANRGFASEFATRLIKNGGARGPVRMGQVEVLLHHPTAFAALADAMVTAERSLELRLHTELIAAAPDLSSLELICRGRREMVEPRTVIDASGDASAAALCGAACEMEGTKRLQRPAFIFSLAGLAEDALRDEARLRIAHSIATAVTGKLLPDAALGAGLRASPQSGQAYVTLDLDPVAYDPLDPECLTGLEIQGRRLAFAVAEFLRQTAPGFEKSHVAAFPARAGIRESRRVTGQYCLTAEDLARGATFPDAIAVASWPIELRETARGARLRFPADNAPCDIPLGCLRARDRTSLFMAGRCLSASHEAQASIRVMGTCFATGEAAGLAASLLANDGACTAEGVNSLRTEARAA